MNISMFELFSTPGVSYVHWQSNDVKIKITAYIVVYVCNVETKNIRFVALQSDLFRIFSERFQDGGYSDL